MILQTTRSRRLSAVFLAFAALLFVAACSADNGDDPGFGEAITPGVVITTAEPTASGVPEEPAATATPGPVVGPSPIQAEPNGDPNLRGFIYPIAGGCLPQGNQLMPNAPRNYRNGTHEGVDFYDSDNCVSITRGTPVLAAKAGTVIRADLGYENPTPQQMQAYLASPNLSTSLDAFRGRQVWIRHDDGGFYVTRYAHLDAIAPGIGVGTRVVAGQLVAYVGESGTPESVSNPGNEYHLHFEMRVGTSYLGAGQSPAQVRQLYLTLFSP